MSDRIVYTPAEVAELLGVHETTVRRWIRAGSIPHVKVGVNERILIPKGPFHEQFGVVTD